MYQMLSSVQSAKRKYHLGRTLPKENSNGIHINYLTRDPTMALNYLTQILKHGNRIMCFGPSGMEHVSLLSQNKHSFFKSPSGVNNQTKFYDESRKKYIA